VFGAIYLLSHGTAKIVLVALVLKDKLRAYPSLTALLLAVIGYQLYRITAVHFSIGLTAPTVFDALLVWLTWREYRSKRTGDRRPGPRTRLAPGRPPDCQATARPQVRTIDPLAPLVVAGPVTGTCCTGRSWRHLRPGQLSTEVFSPVCHFPRRPSARGPRTAARVRI
jgi:Predicted membrane protein (DUF2127)